MSMPTSSPADIPPPGGPSPYISSSVVVPDTSEAGSPASIAREIFTSTDPTQTAAEVSDIAAKLNALFEDANLPTDVVPVSEEPSPQAEVEPSPQREGEPSLQREGEPSSKSEGEPSPQFLVLQRVEPKAGKSTPVSGLFSPSLSKYFPILDQHARLLQQYGNRQFLIDYNGQVHRNGALGHGVRGDRLNRIARTYFVYTIGLSILADMQQKAREAAAKKEKDEAERSATDRMQRDQLAKQHEMRKPHAEEKPRVPEVPVSKTRTEEKARAAEVEADIKAAKLKRKREKHAEARDELHIHDKMVEARIAHLADILHQRHNKEDTDK